MGSWKSWSSSTSRCKKPSKLRLRSCVLASLSDLFEIWTIAAFAADFLAPRLSVLFMWLVL